MDVIRALSLVAMLVMVPASATAAAAAEWHPAAFASQEVLEFHTVNSDGDGHWSKVWLVVLDGDVYIRLGDRAADRIEGNTAGPVVKIRIAGEQFDRVVAESMPDKAEAVAAAMGEKYWSDVLIRYFPHRLTMRLRPETGP